jgi:hypothetical protein
MRITNLINILILFFILFTPKCLSSNNTNNTYTVQNEKYVLFKDGNTDYIIYISKNASSSEEWSAKELQHWLKEISGTEFNIIQYSNLDMIHQEKHCIFVGYDKLLGNKIGYQEPKTNDESFHYMNDGPNIYIYGGKQRGTMYGVMTFLENEFKCRWYTSEINRIPQCKEYTFTSLNHSESPGVQIRDDYFSITTDPIWSARNKMNGKMDPTNQPGGTEVYYGVHTFFQYLPPSEFYEKHPEYYSLINGKRVADQGEWKDKAQLCLSNPDVLKIMIERVKEKIRQHPNCRIFSVSQNDYLNPCQCDNCQKIVKNYGGKESGILIWFVNQVAEAIEKEFPDKYIGTLAYQYTRSAPSNIKPRKNVVIRLCPIEACVAHPLESCPKNQSFMKDLREWAHISPQLYIWDYVVNFQRYIMPYPNFKVLQPNIQTFINNKAIGILELGSYQERGSEFQELKAYLISKLLWNPYCNTDSIIDDFMHGFYGKSGRYIRKYFDLIQQAVTPTTHFYIGMKANDPLFSDKLVEKSLKILNKARKVATDDEMIRRVDMATLPILYLKCRRTPIIARNDGTFNRFLEILKKEKITKIAEYGEYLDSFKSDVLNAK